VACPFLVVGPDPRDPTAPRIKKHTKTSDERIAKDFLLRFELSLFENPKPEPPKEPPSKTLDEAVEHYLGTKKRKSKPRQQKHSANGPDVSYLKETFNRRTVRDVARFVSGYIFIPGTETGRALGGGATHAWMQAYLPGAGWIDFDPTNSIIGNRNLIRVAVAWDPEQVLPLWGTFDGKASAFLGMDVTVSVTEIRPEDDYRTLAARTMNRLGAEPIK
jgi:Transglutaminase-like superfamily